MSSIVDSLAYVDDDTITTSVDIGSPQSGDTAISPPTIPETMTSHSSISITMTSYPMIPVTRAASQRCRLTVTSSPPIRSSMMSPVTFTSTARSSPISVTNSTNSVFPGDCCAVEGACRDIEEACRDAMDTCLEAEGACRSEGDEACLSESDSSPSYQAGPDSPGNSPYKPLSSANAYACRSASVSPAAVLGAADGGAGGGYGEVENNRILGGPRDAQGHGDRDLGGEAAFFGRISPNHIASGELRADVSSDSDGTSNLARIASEEIRLSSDRGRRRDARHLRFAERTIESSEEEEEEENGNLRRPQERGEERHHRRLKNSIQTRNSMPAGEELKEIIVKLGK